MRDFYIVGIVFLMVLLVAVLAIDTRAPAPTPPPVEAPKIQPMAYVAPKVNFETPEPMPEPQDNGQHFIEDWEDINTRWAEAVLICDTVANDQIGDDALDSAYRLQEWAKTNDTDLIASDMQAVLLINDHIELAWDTNCLI